ncbi:MAG: alginate export family protein [Candidatus Omnitrophica bacterium]|nr:alginate export family protein [Candidatus Omnitrophota bacterium]
MRLKHLFILATVAVLFFMTENVNAEDQLNFKWGGALRLRHEYWKNWKDMSNDLLDTRNFFRFKTSVWGNWSHEDLGLFVKLTNENKAYTFYGQEASSTAESKKNYRYVVDEFVFDNLYLDIKSVFDLPLDLRIGRQDFLGTYGEGFLIMDGTPQDGSRTFYFNALKAAWKIDDNNNLDFIYTNNPRDDKFLPVFNQGSSPQALNTTDEEAYILYWKNRSVENLALEGYYIYKREAALGGRGTQAEKGIINTVGSYAKRNFDPYTLRGQLAYQFGDYGNQDRSALGGYIFLDRIFKDTQWSPKTSAGFLYLSGDDTSTSKNEAWNPLFSRWPWMSELYVLNTANTGVMGYWTNVVIYRTELSLKPTEKLSVQLWYNYLRAAEKTAASAALSLSGTGKERGHLPQFRVDYKINNNISTYFLAEYLIPGDFYASDADEALFLRTEVQIRF